jgi:RNA polymerase sigma-70 factor (ECF subfamily)
MVDGMPLDDENVLIMQAQKGDVMAFEALVHRYDKQVLSLALNYVHNRDDAKDIYQEVFLRVHRALSGFRFESKFSTWLHRIATNVCLTHRSKQKRHRIESIDERIEVDNGSSYSLSDVLRDDTTPDRPALDAEISRQVRNAMESLSPQQKVVFTLRHFQGHKLKEIATMMNCAEGTVKKHLFTANERLRDQLKDVLR